MASSSHDAGADRAKLISKLFTACETGDVEAIEGVLKVHKDAARQFVNRQNETALQVAVMYGRVAIMRLLIEHGAEVDKPQRHTGRTALHFAAQGTNLPAVGLLFRANADLLLTDMYSHTPFYYVVERGPTEMAKMFLRYGADANMEMEPGVPVLYYTARAGRTELARMLLLYDAKPDVGYGSDTPLMAAVRGQHYDTVEVLLDGGAQVNRENHALETALDVAVNQNDVRMVRLLRGRAAVMGIEVTLSRLNDQHDGVEVVVHERQRRRAPAPSALLGFLAGDRRPHHKVDGFRPELGDNSDGEGVDKPAGLDGGDVSNISVESPSSERCFSEDLNPRVKNPPKPETAKALNAKVAFKGPPIGRRGRRDTGLPKQAAGALFYPPTSFDDDQRACCESVQISIMDFYVRGDEELRLPVDGSVFEVLYGKGPQTMRQEARKEAGLNAKPDFTWYHIPSNNRTWAEHLITKLRAESGQDCQDGREGRMLRRMRQDMREWMRLAEPQSGKDGSGPLFMAAGCQGLKRANSDDGGAGSGAGDGDDRAKITTLIMPYLDYEKYTSFLAMRASIDKCSRRRRLQLAHHRPAYKERYDIGSIPIEGEEDPEEDSGDAPEARPEEKSPEEKSHNIFSWLYPKPKTRRKFARFFGESTSPGEADDLEKQNKTDLEKFDKQVASIRLQVEAKRQALDDTKAWSTGRTPSLAVDQPGDAAESIKTFATYPPLSKSQKVSQESSPSSKTQGASSPPKQPSQQGPKPVNAPQLHRLLMSGYLASGRGSVEGGLQPRRTLDQYRYSHVGNIRERDGDQVIYRYTKGLSDPDCDEGKLFMVDQLWMWKLDDDTLLTCLPTRWDEALWAADRGGDQRLPTDVHRMVLDELREYSRRGPVLSVHRLADMVLRSCTSIFSSQDRLRHDPSLDFFDFFEKSITELGAKVAQCLAETEKAVKHSRLVTIEEEMGSLGEISDIIDELDMLRDVLHDQLETLKAYNELLPPLDGPIEFLYHEDKDGFDVTRAYLYPRADLTFAKTHMESIAEMRKEAEKIKESLVTLMGLKQQHSSHLEAKLAAEQAESTAKQGKAVLLFTIITVIFLPISFMAAFFAIPSDGFQFNAAGKLPMKYVLKFLLSVGLALSLPFVIIALNLDKAARVFRWVCGLFKTPLNHHKSRRENDKHGIWWRWPSSSMESSVTIIK